MDMVLNSHRKLVEDDIVEDETWREKGITFINCISRELLA